jgi:hypothetical protein
MSELGQRIKKVELAEERIKSVASNNNQSNNTTGGNFALKKSATLKGDL